MCYPLMVYDHCVIEKLYICGLNIIIGMPLFMDGMQTNVSGEGDPGGYHIHSDGRVGYL